MSFEQLPSTQKGINEVLKLDLADNFGREKMMEVKKDIIKSTNKIKNTNVFSDGLIDSKDLVFFDIKDKYKARYKFRDGDIKEPSQGEYELNDFLRGKRIDFVGIHTERDFEEFMDNALKEKDVFDIYFFNKSLTYDEFVTHELAHGLFDEKYRNEYGKYENENENEISDVSDEYREKIKNIIIPLVKNKYPDLNVERFTFERQQIAEIFAYLYEREFCKRDVSNVEMHDELDKRIEKFAKNPEGFIKEVNEEDDKNFKLINDVYTVSHTLSFISARLLELEYPNFEERQGIF